MSRTKLRVQLVASTPCADFVADSAASICVGKEPSGKSLGHALSSGHESVLEHVSYTFKISGLSRACSHQLVRHRLASYSQKSQRYVNENEFDYIVPPAILSKDDTNEIYWRAMNFIEDVYEMLIEKGVPQEDARYILPNACSTDLIMTMNARELRHFFNLRCCTRAQWEIRALANEMLRLCKERDPILFRDAGPSCESLHYCPERRSCGRYPNRM